MTKREEALLEAWRTEVSTRPDDVDPEEAHDWFDLAYGFFLGKGLEPNHAKKLAVETQRRGLL